MVAEIWASVISPFVDQWVALIIANSTGESGVAGRELLANQIIRNEGVVITRKKVLN